jgi:cytochrome c oxidase subunit 3
MTTRVIDVSELPTTGFGSRMTIWWGMVVFLAIEGTVLAMLAATYLYLWRLAPSWPPADTPSPTILRATVNVLLLVASVPLATLGDRAARREDDRQTLAYVLAVLGVGVVALVLRGFELHDLNCRWSDNAYASTVWTITGMHGTHLLVETLENLLLAIVFVTGKRERKHFVDVHVNMVYWYFVVGAWVPLYALVFLLPQP